MKKQIENPNALVQKISLPLPQTFFIILWKSQSSLIVFLKTLAFQTSPPFHPFYSMGIQFVVHTAQCSFLLKFQFKVNYCICTNLGLRILFLTAGERGKSSFFPVLPFTKKCLITGYFFPIVPFSPKYLLYMLASRKFNSLFPS